MTVAKADIAPLIDRDRLVERLRELVQIPSENPPGDEAEVARLVDRRCRELGLDTSTHESESNRPSVVARWSQGEGRVVGYCSHIDVVPAGDHALWGRDPYGGEIVDNRLHGRGSGDAKGPCAAALEAVAALRDAGLSFDGMLEMSFVADEEAAGFKGAGFLVADGIIKPDIAIVGEPTSLRVVRAQRGVCWMRITTRGRAGHGSAPERAVNAVAHMAEIISHLEATLPDIVHPVVGGPSIGVGTIRGGEKVNIVPASCVAEIDRRSVPPETKESVIASVTEAVEMARARFPDIDAVVELPHYGDPFEVPESSEVVTQTLAAVEDAIEGPGQIMGFRGASDARFMAEAGADVVVCGPGDITLAHTARESIDIDELHSGALAYALAFARLLAPAGG
ncbi:MAG TPA: M20 family metallopeptidase [Actinomycetota bacterium]|nr:M20 family metallopeptidase [Actinomycetota bacterium]